MTHEPELSFEEKLVGWLDEQYGEENVDAQVYQPAVRWFCDIVVDLEWCRLYIEVENDKDSIRDGLGQAIGYAAQDMVAGVPMVVTPKGHVDDARLARYRRGSSVLIREFDEQAMQWV